MRESCVVDASVAIKWVCGEELTLQALALRRRFDLVAPELLLAECANILWKKVRLGEVDVDTAVLSAEVLARADIELVPHRRLTGPATRLAVALGQSAYDCMYLALALDRNIMMATADDRLSRKIGQSGVACPSVLSLRDLILR